MRHILSFLLLLFVLFSNAQTAQTTFGKNRVQYAQKKWKYISTKNFNVYYYIGGNSLAYNTARHLEEQYNQITQTIGYLPYNKINVLVYTSDADFQQSNISLENNFSAGGETKLIKSKIEVSYKGSQMLYFREVDKKLSELFINIIMYGGSFKNSLQSTYLIDFPAWFLNGCSNFLGYGASEKMNNAVQDFIHSKKKNPDRLTGEYATLIGQSIFNYIHEKYGDYAIANILALTKSTRNEETGIRGSLGIEYQIFIKEWKQYYQEKFNKTKIEKRTILHNSNSAAAITQIKMNRDKSMIAYALNRKGIYYVYVYDLIKKNRKIVYYGGIKNINWETDQSIPLIAWKSNSELCLIKYKNGKPYLITKNVTKKFQKEKKLFVTFDAILSFDFAPNEEDMTLSGVKDGQTDIYIYNTKEDVAKQITKDLYDDFDPVYSPDGKRILFSSNRFNDTLRGDYGSYQQLLSIYNLFEFDGTKLLKRITNSNVSEKKPFYWSNTRILFLASNGSQNKLYTLTIGESIAKNIATEDKSIVRFLAKEGELFLQLRRKERDLLLHKTKGFEFDPSLNYLALQSQKLEISSKEVPDEVLINDLLNINPNKQGYDSDPLEGPIKKTKPVVEKTTKISDPKDIEALFAVDYVISTFKIDPIRNFGTYFQAGTSDMFSNHRIQGALYSTVLQKSSDIVVQYEYLKRQYDFRIKLQKNSFYRGNNISLNRQTKSDFNLSIAKPFSPVARLEYSTGLTRTAFTDYLIPSPESNYNVLTHNKLEFVYDNSFEKSLNQFQGFRFKASAESYGKISGNLTGFNKLSFDMRNYQPIIRDIIFAARVSGGRFGGNSPKVFMLGGVDNWLGQQYENNTQLDPLYLNNSGENPYLLFSDFSTNLRGFGYNKMNGRNYLLLNTEVRVPIIRVLYSGPISSSFFRNLQFNAFYEAGSAWNGKHPFGRDNSINTRNVGKPGNVFTAKVTNYQNPFLTSYGFGFRSMMFGYYLKVDLGWGIKNYLVQKPKLQVSLDYDF